MNKALKIFILHGKIHTALFHKSPFLMRTIFKLISSHEPFVLHYSLPCHTNSFTFLKKLLYVLPLWILFLETLNHADFVSDCHIYRKASHCSSSFLYRAYRVLLFLPNIYFLWGACTFQMDLFINFILNFQKFSLYPVNLKNFLDSYVFSI